VRSLGIADPVEQAPKPPRCLEPHEDVAQEDDPEDQAQQARLDDNGDPVRVRAVVRLPRHELVVHGEVVFAEPEERVEMQDLADEVVYGEVRARRTAVGREPLAQERREEVAPRVEHTEEHEGQGA